MIALIDGDVLLHKACNICEHNIYTDLVTDLAYRRQRDVPEGHEYQKDRYVGSLVDTTEAFKSLLVSIRDNSEAESYIVYLSPSRTFRHDLAVTKPYKGSRKGVSKPTHFAALKDHVVENYSPVLCDYVEADDGMGIAQCHLNGQGVDTIICTIDKDLLMIPGNHYNLTSKESRSITLGEGYTLFYRQMLTGDSVDDIVGIRGIGPVKAKKLIPEIAEEVLSDWMRKGGVVEAKYKEFFGDIWKYRLDENKQLLWILREAPEGQDVEFYTPAPIPFRKKKRNGFTKVN